MEYGHMVLAGTKSGFIPKAIKWFTESKFSHSFVTMPDLLETPICIEALGSGVDISRFDTGYENNLDQGYEVYKIKIDQKIKAQAVQQVTQYLEVKYGYLEYPWFIYRRLMKFFGKDIKNQNNWNTDGMICSQLCVAYLTECGLSHVLKDYGKGSIAPQDLQNVFKANPDIFELIQTVRL